MPRDTIATYPDDTVTRDIAVITKEVSPQQYLSPDEGYLRKGIQPGTRTTLVSLVEARGLEGVLSRHCRESAMA